MSQDEYIAHLNALRAPKDADEELLWWHYWWELNNDDLR